MPKLLSLNSYHYRRGGADVVYFEHDSLFRKLGWDTACFSMHHPQNVPSDWAAYFVNELQYGHSYSARQKVSMAAKVIYSREAGVKLGMLLKQFRPDVAHAHNLYHHLSPSVLPVLREAKIPVILTAHDLKLCCPSHQMMNRRGLCELCKGGNFLHTVINRCVHDSLAVSALVATESILHRWTGVYRNNLDRIVLPSRFYERKFREWGWPAEQLCYIPNFVKVEDFEASPRVGDYFVYFGRLAIEKGFTTLLAASRLSGSHLTIVGSGELDAQARVAAAESGGKITWVGRQSGKELWALVQGARAVVLPSEWYENAPMSVLEAYALGKPVIGADIGGIPELIAEGETGWLFPSADPAGLAETMERVAMLGNSQIARMGAAARNFVSDNFTAAHYRDRMLGLYRSLGVNVGR